ncbi:carboxypeptidase-like regulatory domain-containing protein [Taibaiella koreensis]|uniref:carboxypeptidase-like regulatory domain-containing protein n=1 Tax=Taibaiella koreensis TaxID=1268548 RepID=UPI000E599373|nr:carboxypeptidase-like regulatory domain-containing protein [Taibaiella koreensis]
MTRYAFSLVLFMLLFPLAAQAQLRQLHGTVVDEKGEGIPGATVRIKGGLPDGAVTDLDGKFELDVARDSVRLEIDAIGFQRFELLVSAARSEVHITLQQSSLDLEEVVVTGRVVSRRQMTGAASMSSASQITRDRKGKGTTWKRSGLPENAIRLETGDEEYLPLKAAQVAVKVDGFRVRVLLDCFFYNDLKNGIEGVFKLKLPTGATPYYFAFGETVLTNTDDLPGVAYVDYLKQGFHLSPDELGKDTSRVWQHMKEARIVSRQKAARAYEETVGARIDPALMEWAGADMFSCRVFPLAKGKMHRIVIGYDLNMTEALDFRSYELALPGTGKLRVAMDIAAGGSLQPEISPVVVTVKRGDRIQFMVEDPKEKAYTVTYPQVDPLMLYDSVQGYFGGSYRINLPEIAQADLPSKAVFLLDLSLSANPDKFNVWLKLIEEVLEKNRDVIKEFAVLTFNIEKHWWEPHFVRNNSYNLNRFLDYAQTLALEGATDLGSALAEASAPSWIKQNLPKHIFLMSDGDYNWGESNLNALQAVLHPGDRIHTYKTGLPGTNAEVLNTLSKRTNGFAFTVTGEEEAALTAKSFRYRPWNIEAVRVEGVRDFLISGQPTQLYNGQKLILAGKGRPGGDIYLKLSNGTETRELLLAAGQPLASGLSARIYGQLALSSLAPYVQADETVKDATEAYAQHFRIPGETMSFLMLESRSDYYRYDIDDDASEAYVQHHLVAALLEKWRQLADGPPLGNGKADFMAWLGRLRQHKRLAMDTDTSFLQYVGQLPPAVFSPGNGTATQKPLPAGSQTDDELEMLGNERLKYDNLLPLAEERKRLYGRMSALTLMSSVIERNPADYVAFRDLSLKAIDWDMGVQAYYMIRRLISAREELALSYLIAARALERAGENDLALVYYYICTHCHWDRDYGSIREIASLYHYRMLDRLLKQPEKLSPAAQQYYRQQQQQVRSYLVKEDLFVPEADVVVILSWNIDNTDIDLHVKDPSGEECFYRNRETKLGGRLTIDVTNGFGPEMFVQENAASGVYRTWLEYYNDDQTKTSSKAKAYVELYKNWGRPREKLLKKVIVLEKPALKPLSEDDANDKEDEAFEIQKFSVLKRIR